MKILLKSFFRNKHIKVYLVICSVMLASLTIAFKYVSFYSNIVTKTYNDNSYYFVVSDKDVYEYITDKNETKEVERILLLKCNNSSSFFIKNNLMCYDLLDKGNEYLVGVSDNNSDLLENQISLIVPNSVLVSFENSEIVNDQDISFIQSKDIFEYKVKSIMEGKFSRIILPNNQFNKLLSKNNQFGYIVKARNYDDINSFEKMLDSIDNVKTVKLIQSIDSESTFNTMKELIPVISTLKYGSILFSILLFILFFLFINSIIKEEKEKMNTEMLLGYSKRQIKIILMLKLLLFNIIVLLFSLILFVFSAYLIQLLFDCNLNIFDIVVLFQLMFAMFLLSSPFCIILKQK